MQLSWPMGVELGAEVNAHRKKGLSHVNVQLLQCFCKSGALQPSLAVPRRELKPVCFWSKRKSQKWHVTGCSLPGAATADALYPQQRHSRRSGVRCPSPQCLSPCSDH